MAAELKTQENDASVDEFLASIQNEQRRGECRVVCDLMREVSGAEPRMWGTSIVGFGRMHYKGASGREGYWFPIGFAPRKQNLTIYFSPGFEAMGDLLERLGKHSKGMGCLYLNKLSDADPGVLREMVARTLSSLKER